MAVLTETRHAGGFMVSEANGFRSRETVTVLSGQVLQAGTVLGRITASGKYVAWEASTSAEADGSTTVRAILYGPVDATAGDTKGVIVIRDAEVNGGELVYPAGTQPQEKAVAIAALLALGIIVR
ncbi:bacteriophage lambda head decoration protein D [Stella humosa]|uniref:Bacteriophage lambda head decoration protein D n=1 Tax=Stella humosa TaxID=94 RepID=A0A3N1M9U3_9PROT|nr:head decoration protein [Stella humosa]ROQ00453.1 bacteriophage lambda head decoration protein D [Stella humosa]BBK30302.1 hypothetical protein STHU_09360 [Stella humosa]